MKQNSIYNILQTQLKNISIKVEAFTSISLELQEQVNQVSKTLKEQEKKENSKNQNKEKNQETINKSVNNRINNNKKNEDVQVELCLEFGEIQDITKSKNLQKKLQNIKNSEQLIKVIYENEIDKEDLQRILQQNKIQQSINEETKMLIRKIIEMKDKIEQSKQELEIYKQKEQDLHQQQQIMKNQKIEQEEENHRKYQQQKCIQSYKNQKFDELDKEIKNAKNYNLDLSFINLDKKYQDDNNTIFEKCILYQKYKNIRQYCCEQRNNKYNIDMFFEYAKNGNVEGMFWCIVNNKNPEDQDTQKIKWQDSQFHQYFDHNQKAYMTNFSTESFIRPTALIWTCYFDHYKAAQMLIKCFQVDINQSVEGGCTALMIACKRNSIETIKLLIENAANVDLKDKQGKTCYHYISQNGVKRQIREFIANNKLQIRSP